MVESEKKEEKVLYSYELRRGFKEYNYIRYDLWKSQPHDEKIYCKNDAAFLIFLAHKNDSERYSKYHSKAGWVVGSEEADKTMNERLVIYFEKILKRNVSDLTKEVIGRMIKRIGEKGGVGIHDLDQG